MDQALRLFSGEALDYLGAWVEAIAAGRDGGHNAAAVTRAADALRLDGLRLPPRIASPPLPAPAAAPAAGPAAAETQPETPASEAAAPAPAELDFEFDLGDEAEARAASGSPRLTGAARTRPAECGRPGPRPERGGDEPASTATRSRSACRSARPTPPAADHLAFSLDLDTLGVPWVPDVPVPAADAQPLRLLDLPLEVPQPTDEAVADLPALEVRTVEMDTGFVDLMFPPPSARTPPAPEPTPVLDFDVAALEAAIDREEAPTEVLSASDVSPVEPTPADDEQIKVIGPLRIGIPLFNIYLNEADELSRRLGTELAEWSLEHERHPVPETSVALAHSLAGSSATVGYSELSALARALEHALMRSHAAGHGRDGEPELFNDTADEIRRLLHQFAAGFLRPGGA